MLKQLSPFITLTRFDDNKRVTVNINHIVHMEDQTSRSNTRVTYISLTSPATTSIHVKENFDEVLSLINKYYSQG
jgi:hypothetical protein